MIQVTPAAYNEISRLSQRAGLAHPQIRLGIKSGGCLERIYMLEVRSIIPQDDLVIDCQVIGDRPVLRVAVNPDALPYLDQLTLDYSEDLMGGTFRFTNPRVTQTCSCGQSFALP